MTMALPSNGGYKRLGFRLGRRSTATTLLADVRLSSCFSFLGPSSSQLTLRRVPIARSRLWQLASALDAWLQRPAPFTVDLVEDQWNALEIAVGDDTTGGLQKPGCEVSYRWVGTAGTFGLVLDQSCIRMFHNDVSACLRLWGSR